MNQIAKLLPLANVVVALEASSKKRLFEQVGLLFENNHSIARNVVFDALSAVEAGAAQSSLFLFDAASFMTRVLKVSINPNLAPITELVDYDLFCGVKPIIQNNHRNITVEQLLQRFQTKENLQLIDVRETHEFEGGFIENAISMPLSVFERFIPTIQKDKPVVLYCQSGKRSAKALQQLIDNHGFTNIVHLENGFAGWLKSNLVSQ